MIELKNSYNFYSQLISSRYQGLYNQILYNLAHEVYTTSMEMSVGNEFPTEMQAVITAVLMGCPELFYVGQETSYEYRDGRVIVNFPNNYPDMDHEAMNVEMYEIINEVVEGANQLENEMEKIMFVNQYLSTSITPEFSLTEDNGNAYGALVKKVARCEGYVEAAKLIFDALNIDSIICLGEVPYDGERIAHAWIAVKYQDEYYAFDIAWNGSMTVNGIVGVVYTFMNQEFISIEHFSDYHYPITSNDEYLFWKLHNGDAEYIYELQNADVLECGNGLYSVHHLVNLKFDEYQQEYELPEIVRDELSPLSKAQTFHFAYREDIDVLMVYYINF